MNKNRLKKYPIPNKACFNIINKVLLIIFILSFLINSKEVKALSLPKIKVPKKIYFGKMRIYMCNSVRSKIQAKVDSLRRWKFKEMVDQANLIFPIMDPILQEEGIPQDIKFLAMHESRLVLNCISHTEDYGIWAFNNIAIKEVGITVNNKIDERFHLVYSTRAMCKKMKINYKYFKNWIHAILAYNKGRTGTENIIKAMGRKYIKKQRGKSIFLNINTPNYLIYFLAHKLAFENEIGKHRHPEYKLYVHEVSECDNFHEIANKTNSSLDLLCKYNPWLKCPKYIIPKNKKHKIIVPLKHKVKNRLFSTKKLKSKDNLMLVKNLDSGKQNLSKKKIKNQNNTLSKLKKDEYPKISQSKDFEGKKITLINGLLGVVAKKGMNLKSLAKKGGLSINDFIRYNDINFNHTVIEGQVYYFVNKRSKGQCKYHIAQKGDNWWSISQKYGIKMNRLLLINNRTSEKPKKIEIDINRILHLKFIRPKSSPIKFA
ncbi:MAG: transglycosylase SLT domain-containing protein [Bacteroidetes bacterium]|nr:transglycosylase SLT domain-containing protein [Bacteroidota bacterium]